MASACKKHNVGPFSTPEEALAAGKPTGEYWQLFDVQLTPTSPIVYTWGREYNWAIAYTARANGATATVHRDNIAKATKILESLPHAQREALMAAWAAKS